MTSINDNSVFLNLGNSSNSTPSFANATTANLQQEARTGSGSTSTSQLLANVGLGQISNTLNLLSDSGQDSMTYNLLSLKNSSNTSIAASGVSDEIAGVVNRLIDVIA